MKSLNEVRDELAEEYAQDDFKQNPNGYTVAPYVNAETTEIAFSAGFDAALRTLAEGAGEFDGVMESELVRHVLDMTQADYFAAGAEFQYEKDRARIGLYKQERDASLAESEFQAARLEKAERERDEYRTKSVAQLAELAAAEVERDKAKADHAYRYNLCDQLTQHNHKLEQRVKELELILSGKTFDGGLHMSSDHEIEPLHKDSERTIDWEAMYQELWALYHDDVNKEPQVRIRLLEQQRDRLRQALENVLKAKDLGTMAIIASKALEGHNGK